MLSAEVFGQVLPFPRGAFPSAAPRGRQVGAGEARSRSGVACRNDRQQALDAVHDALSAAMTADRALCLLRVDQALRFCADRPHAAWAARQELVRLLGVDIVARHLGACEKRRHLRRELEEATHRLRQLAAPTPA